MRGEYFTADDVADAARDLIKALERAGAPDVEVSADTVTVYSERGPCPAHAVDCTIAGGSALVTTFYDVDTDGRRSLAGALVNHDADDQAEFAVSRLRWLANRTTTPKE